MNLFQMRAEPLQERILGQGSDKGFDRIPVYEKNQRWDAPDIETSGFIVAKAAGSMHWTADGMHRGDPPADAE